MEKKKSPSTRSKSKKYDFETPLNPFEGESLKGIAAFIESSVTLQSPGPLAPDRTGRPENRTYSENLPAADSSDQFNPITATSVGSAAVSSTHGIGSIGSAGEIEIGTLNTLGQYLVDRRSQTKITELVSPLSEIGIMSTHVTPFNGDQDTVEIGTLITKSQNVDLDRDAPPSVQMATDPRCEPNVKETRSSDDRISKITSFSEHGGDELQSVIGTLGSSTAADFGNEEKHDALVPTIESHGSTIMGTHNSHVSSTPITSVSVTARELRVPDDEEKSSLILGVPNSRVPSTPITFESATNHERSRRVPEPIKSAMVGTPNLSVSSTPARVLYLKIHVAVRGQDGLNKGEEKIYTFLWRTTYRSKEMGKPEFRTEANNIEISLRDIARKVGLGLANCAWHMHCLEEKGCIAKVKETDHYHPAVYYVREFGQILDWRKEHGLTHFIQRGHLAAFVDPESGMPITRFRGQTGTIYQGKFVSSTPSTINGRALDTPELSILDTTYGVLNSIQDSGINSSTPSVIDSNTQLKKVIGIKLEVENQYASTSEDAPIELITLLHSISPTIDQEAAVFLWDECRVRATDCTVEEVLYFTGAKAAILEPSKIRNPVGFLLAAVPKCFEGEMFKIFRRDQARRQEEIQRREAEERSRAQSLEQEAQREVESYRMAEERLAALPEAERETLYQQVRSELHTKYPRLQWPDRQALDDRIRLGMIRELQKQLLAGH